jgi:flagellar basal-body rod protein FlgG
MTEPGGTTQEGVRLPGSLQVGLGVKAANNTRSFSQGNIQNTGNPMDMAIRGDGFFQVRLPDQSVAYTRDGTFKVNADGIILTSDGYPLEPQIQVPPNSTEFNVSPDGRVMVKLQNDTMTTEIGQIDLAVFVNPAGLKAQGQNLYAATEASGQAITGAPGQNGAGEVASQYLEASNVQLVDEMVSLIVAQRAYEISSKAVSVADEMLQNANGLKR